VGSERLFPPGGEAPFEKTLPDRDRIRVKNGARGKGFFAHKGQVPPGGGGRNQRFFGTKGGRGVKGQGLNFKGGRVRRRKKKNCGAVQPERWFRAGRLPFPRGPPAP